MVRTLTATMLLALAGGCSFLFPGLSTRLAAQSKNRVEWQEFVMEEDTTHRREVIVAEGEAVGVTMVDGNATGITGATHVLWQKSDPEQVMVAYAKLAEQNAKVAEQMFAALQAMTETVAPLVAASATVPALIADPLPATPP